MLAAAALAAAALATGAGAQDGSADAPAPAAARLPAEAYAELPFVSQPQLSPDGTRIAARLMVEGSHRIGVWRLSDPRDDPPRLIEAANSDSFAWAGDERLLVTTTNLLIVSFQGLVLPIPVRRVASHEIESGERRLLGGEASLFDEVIFVDPAGRFVLLSTQTRLDRSPAVHRVDLATGRSVEVQRSRAGIERWFADPSGVVRAGVDYGERRTRLYYRATPDGELRLVDSRRHSRDDSVVDMVRFVTDASRGFVISNAETGRFALHEYDFAADARGAVLFEHPEVDVDAAIFAEDGTVDGVVYEEDRPRVHWLNPRMEQLQRAIDSALPGMVNRILNASRDGNRVLIFSSAADDPGTYYVFDRGARQLDIFASPYAGLHGRAFAPVRPVSYASRDGLTIRGYLTLPPGGERGLPLIVLPHGGPFLRDGWYFNPEVQFLASRGYAVLQPNFRGSTGYGRDFVERGYGQLGTGMIDDMDDGVDWLAREGIVDPARVCIMGSSYGGYAAIWGAMRNPGRYRCAVSWAGPTDLNAMLRADMRFLRAERYARERRRRQLRGEERADLNAVSPLRQAQLLSVPLLIGHGEQDSIVPVAQSRDLLRALERRGARVEAHFYPKSGHDFGSAEDSADFLRRVEAFLARHNPAG